MDAPDEVDDALLDHEIALYPDERLGGVWRTLCARMLYQTLLARKRFLTNVRDAETKRAAQAWMAGGGM
jgi:hypothetical protein